jgi:hypothetical protein
MGVEAHDSHITLAKGEQKVVQIGFQVWENSYNEWRLRHERARWLSHHCHSTLGLYILACLISI